MAVELTVPSAGESITEVQIGTWLKKEGDFVQQDENVVEIETDKASMELPAPAAGKLQSLKFAEGDTVNVGDVIALIDESAEAPEGRSSSDDGSSREKADSADAQSEQGTKKSGSEPSGEQQRQSSGSEAFVMPAAARALHETGISKEQVSPSGPGGRMLKEDVLDAKTQKSAAKPASKQDAPSVNGERGEEAVPMTMLRRRIAERLVESQQTAALLTTFNEIDMSAVIALRKRWQDDFVKKYDIKLGFMSLFVKAAIDALKLVPEVNAEIRDLPASDGTPRPHVVYHNYFDIGVAVGAPQGLVVPVIRNAERLSFAEIEQTIADLATRARERKLSIDELQGGTFTISNGGIYGSLLSTPIINPPQTGILGLHAINERPVAVDGEVVIRPMMYVALTYDHRIIDGKEAVTFLKRIKECIEEPARMLIEA